MNFFTLPIETPSQLSKSNITEENFNLRLESLQKDFSIASRIKSTLQFPGLSQTEISFVVHGLSTLNTKVKNNLHLESFDNNQDSLKLRVEGVVDSIIDGIKKMIDWIVEKFNSLFGGDDNKDSLSKEEKEKASKNTEEEIKTLTGLGSSFSNFFYTDEVGKIKSGLETYGQSLSNSVKLINQSLNIFSEPVFNGPKNKEAADKLVKDFKELFKSLTISETENKASENTEVLSTWFINGNNRKNIVYTDNLFKLLDIKLENKIPENFEIKSGELLKIHKVFIDKTSKTYDELKVLIKTKNKQIGEKLKAQLEGGSENEVSITKIKIDVLKNIIGSLSYELKKSQLLLIKGFRSDLKEIEKKKKPEGKPLELVPKEEEKPKEKPNGESPELVPKEEEKPKEKASKKKKVN